MDNLDVFDSDLASIDMPEVAVPEVEETPDAPPSAAETAVKADAETGTEEAVVADDAKDAAVAAVAAATGKPANVATKALTFTADGKPVSLTETAEIDWKVDGKMEKVKVRDLLDNWSGKTSYDRKFQELSQQRKGFQEESTAFQRSRERQKTLITDMHKASGEGRIFDAVSNLLEMTGLDKQVDAKQYIGQLREALIKQADTLRGMTPEQRQLFEMKEEHEHLKAKTERQHQQREKEQAEQAFQDRVTKAIDSAKSNPEEFVRTRDWLVERFQAEKYDLKQLTPEYVASHIRDVRDYGIAKEAMESVDPELTKNEALWEQTVLLMRANPTWTKEDVKGIFQKAVGEKRSEAVSAKLAKAPVATAAKGAAKSKLAPKQPGADDFSQFSASDLDW